MIRTRRMPTEPLKRPTSHWELPRIRHAPPQWVRKLDPILGFPWPTKTPLYPPAYRKTAGLGFRSLDNPCQTCPSRYPAPLMDRPQNRNSSPQSHEREPGLQDSRPEAGPFQIPAELGKRLAVTGREFLADLLGTEVQRRPENQRALTMLSQCLAQLDRRLEGLEVDQNLAALEPQNPIVQYNLACSQALNQNGPAAIASLQNAISLGFADASFIANDPDLESLHPLNTFQNLVTQLERDKPE